MKPRVLVLESIHPDGIAKLRRTCEVTVSFETPRAQLLELVRDAAAVIVRSVTQVDRELLDRAPALEVIGRAGTGTDNIDLASAKARGIQVLTMPEGNAVSVAEFTVLQILALCRNAYAIAQAVAANDFRRDRYQGNELSHQTVGIIGVGRIGQLVAHRLRPFGCRLIGFDINEALKPRFAKLGVAWAGSLDELLETSTIVTLHVPRTPQTLGMIGARELSRMPRGARIINTSRGGIIVEAELLKAVERGHVAGAAIDVLVDEPPFHTPPAQVMYTNPLLGHPNIMITPHCAASTEEAQRAIALNLVDAMGRLLSAPAGRSPRPTAVMGAKHA